MKNKPIGKRVVNTGGWIFLGLTIYVSAYFICSDIVATPHYTPMIGEKIIYSDGWIDIWSPAIITNIDSQGNVFYEDSMGIYYENQNWIPAGTVIN